MLKISVITPSFNQGSFLEQTLKSVLDQNYPSFELIVIDGGSKDGSVDILKRYNSQLHYWVSEPDSGQANAINKGLQHATGDIITWLNSDDYFEPGVLQAVADYFSSNPNTDVIHGKSRFFGHGVKAHWIGPNKALQPYEYLSYMRFPQPSAFYRSALLSKTKPLDETLHYGMDFDLVVRSILAGAKFQHHLAHWSHYRLHAESKTNQHLPFLKDWSITLAKACYSVGHGKPILKHMLALGLIDNIPSEKFEIRIHLDEDTLLLAFLEQLHHVYHTYYQLFDKSKCKEISKFIKEQYPAFYTRKQFSKYNRRLNILPEFVHKTARKWIL